MKMIASAMLTVALSGISASALAEGKISIAQQFGIGYLILDVVRDQQLIEKEGKKEGLDIEVDWRTISGATGMNEGATFRRAGCGICWGSTASDPVGSHQRQTKCEGDCLIRIDA